MAEKSNNMKQKAETCPSKHRWKKAIFDRKRKNWTIKKEV